MMKKLLLFLIVGMFMISFVSSAEWDNVLNYDSNKDKIQIKNTLGLPNWLGGSILLEATLENNGCDKEGRFCEAIKTIKLNKETELIQDFKTLRLDDNSNNIENIRWHKLEYWGDINDYKTKCINGKYITENKTYEQVCSNIISGTNKGWIKFNEGDIFPIGTYKVKTSGEIKPGRVYDWQILLEGKWTTPWEIGRASCRERV